MPGGGAASTTDGGGGGGDGIPQAPLVEPWATMQGRPAQQSALTVHAPPEWLHAVWHASLPFAPGTQWPPAQQSLSNAHAPPAFTQAPSAWHRGTPSLSSWQAPELPGAPQQSLRADEIAHA
jgi:hypothetical protein